MQNEAIAGTPTEVIVSEPPSPIINGNANMNGEASKSKSKNSVISPIWNMFTDDGQSPATNSDRLMKFPRIDSVDACDEDLPLNTEKPLIEKPGLKTRNAIKKNIN